MEADKVIEWVHREMGAVLTTTQKDLIRMEFGEAIAYQRTQDAWAAGGHRFAGLLVDAYREEMNHSEGPRGAGCYPPVEDDYANYCRCHSRKGLESHQHENDCPLATSVCVECLRNQSCGKHSGMKGISADYVQVIYDEVPLMETALTEETDG